MDEIFISYARENREAARILAETIEAKGYDCWWDRELIAGEDYTDKIEHLLDNAKAVIVLWSEHSRKSYWVRDEAAVGRDRNRLLPIMIDENIPPLGFRQIHTISLKGWNGKDDEPLTELWEGLKGLVEGEPGRAPRTAPDPEATNPFGGPIEDKPREIARKKIAAGVNATPNNKPIAQILREEKKQRGFLRTYWLTSFVISAIASVVGAVLSMFSQDVMDETLSHIENFIANGIVMFLFCGLGLIVGRFLIVVGRRLSKRKSIRYFDQPTLICTGISVALALLSAWIWMTEEGNPGGWTTGDVIFYAPVVAFVLFFPFCALMSVPIGAIKGVKRKSFQDGM